MQRDAQGTYKNKITDAWRKDDARAQHQEGHSIERVWSLHESDSVGLDRRKLKNTSLYIGKEFRRISKPCVVCVFFPLILDIKFVGRTSRGHTGGRSHRISHSSFCGACLNFSREKDSAIPFPRRP